MPPGPLLPGRPLYTEPPVVGQLPPPAPDYEIVPLPPGDLPQATEVPVYPDTIVGVPEGGVPLPPPDVPAPGVAPSAFEGAGAQGPSMAVAKYNPRTGEYMGSDGHMYKQTDLVNTASSWQDLMPT
jgi:hypothetical protein